jgi:hypothetical protein
MAILPCGHRCLCAEDATKLKLNGPNAKCPICRGPVRGIKEIFDS